MWFRPPLSDRCARCGLLLPTATRLGAPSLIRCPAGLGSLVPDCLATAVRRIKTVLLAQENIGLMIIVAVHDYLLRNEFGIDWAPLTSHIPGWVMPILLAVDFWVIASSVSSLTSGRRADALHRSRTDHPLYYLMLVDQ